MLLSPALSSVSLLLLFVSLLPAIASAQGDVPRFEEAECPFMESERTAMVRCGYLVVAENRVSTGGRTLRLAVAIIPSVSDTPQADPLVFLSGGPGYAAVRNVPRWVDSSFWNGFKQNRDLVFFDQRGTGYSEPHFCPDLDVAIYTASFRGLSVEEQRAFELDAVQECRARMLEEGIDFSSYNSATSASDLDELREALGYREWNLFGVSYGTRLALAAMRESHGGIRSVILDSATPPNAPRGDANERLMRSLQLVFEQCAADASCHAAYPTFEEDFFAIIDRLEAQPVVLAMSDSNRFPDGRIVVDGTVLAAGVFQGLYDQDFVTFLPLLVRELTAGNNALLSALADSLVQDPHSFSQGMYLTVECYEYIPFASPQSLADDRARHPRLAAFDEFQNEQALCEAWHEHRSDPDKLQAVTSDIPTLIAAGEFDPITPPSYGRLAAQSLSNATYVEVQGAAHGVTPYSECTKSIMAAFLNDPGSPPDTTCTATLHRADFITDVFVNPGIYRLTQLAGQPPGPAIGIGLGLMFLLIASAIVVWPIAALVRRLRRKDDAPVPQARAARWLAFLTALLIVLFLAGIGWAIVAAMEENPYLLAVGLTGSAAPLFLLPWIVGLMCLALLAYVVLAWKRDWWTAAGRIHYTLLAAACAAFVLWVAKLGIM